jgi:hypothetical protein
MKKKVEKKVTVAKGVKLPRGKESKERARPGGGSTGKYKSVAPSKFAGKSGGTSAYSFPIDTIQHGRAALSRAHFAPDAAGIRRAVYKRFPQLKLSHEKRHKSKD